MSAQARRGRPKGTGLDDRNCLRAVKRLLDANPDLKPTTAIKSLGITEPSTIRRLREKLRADRGDAVSAPSAAGKENHDGPQGGGREIGQIVIALDGASTGLAMAAGMPCANFTALIALSCHLKANKKGLYELAFKLEDQYFEVEPLAVRVSEKSVRVGRQSQSKRSLIEPTVSYGSRGKTIH